MAKKKFTGVLSEAIKVHKWDPYWEDDLEAERALKMLDLAKHYGIDTEAGDDRQAWVDLLFAMAEDLVPGFKLEVKNRKPKNLDRKARLIIDVNAVKQKRRCSTREAIRILTTSHQHWKGENPRTLQNEFSRSKRDMEAIRRFVEIMKAREP